MKDKRTHYGALPDGVMPRLIGREAAAQWIGVSPSKFDELVRDGRMPPAKRIDGRKVWDRYRIDEKIAELPDDDQANPWDVRNGKAAAA